MQIQSLLAVMLGGSLGALTRYLLGWGVAHWFKVSHLPIATFVVNMLGCFCIGFIAAFFESKQWGLENLRLFIMVGFLGSFTTFSTYIWESSWLFKTDHVLAAIINLGTQVFLGLFLAAAGWIVYSTIKPGV